MSVQQPQIAATDHGLDETAVRERIRRGQVNDVPDAPTRSVAQIVATNVLTRFNALLGGLFVLILVFGDLRDALFGLVLIANSLIGIVQELRAKRALDRLAVIAAPAARVVRGGTLQQLTPGQVVLDDVLEAGPGDQIVVDGEVLSSDAMEVNESLLTGESDPVVKRPGDPVLSGSFVAAGTGRYRATRVGAQAYAADLAAQARRFRMVRSEVRAGIDRILRFITWGLIPSGLLLVFSQLRAHSGVSEAVAASVAGVVAMVPEGLVLLTSAAFAVSVHRLARRRVLVQELAAVEGLARIDVICLDKTGTLTEGDVVVDLVEPLDSEIGAGGDVGGDSGRDSHPDANAALAALAAADPSPNATLRAIATAFPEAPPWQVARREPFSSARKYGAVAFEGHGAWVLGAPELLLPRSAAADGVRLRVTGHAEQGRRVVLLGHAPGLPDPAAPSRGLKPIALVLLSDRIRADAPDTLRYFADQGVAVKLISGDHPHTVAAMARRAGLADTGRGLDARELPVDADELAAAVEAGTIFGRVAPEQKRAMVAALQSRGHVVGMTGDGVNDVLALKEADIGIAMGSGTPAARGVAQVVLLANAFADLPAVVAEGRRVIANIERVAKLFTTKSVYALLLALAVGLAGLPFPFLPRHLSLIASLTIGLPGMWLALESGTQRARPGFVSRVLSSAVPAGLLAGVATFIGYAVSRTQFDVSTEEAQTTATVVLTGVGLVILARLASPLTRSRRVLIALMWAGFALVLAVPAGREFFALNLPPAIVWLSAVGLVAIADRLLELAPITRLREALVARGEAGRPPGVEFDRGGAPRPLSPAP